MRLPKIRRLGPCKKTSDGKHVPDDVPVRKKIDGMWVYGVLVQCFACKKKLRRWRRV